MPGTISSAEYGVLGAVGTFPSIPLNIVGAWDVESYAELYVPLEQVGDDRPVPGVTGRLAQPRELDEGIFGLPFVVYGENDLDGVPYADPRVGLRANLRFLRANVFTPPGTADGTRPFTFHELGGATYAGNVIVQAGASSPRGPILWRSTIRLIVPAGTLA